MDKEVINTHMNLLDIQKIAKDNNYTDVHEKNGSIIAIAPFAFTHAIVAEITTMCYGRRWCYHTYQEALEALNIWINSDEEEPDNWIRRTHIKDPYPPGFDIHKGHRLSDIIHGRLIIT